MKTIIIFIGLIISFNLFAMDNIHINELEKLNNAQLKERLSQILRDTHRPISYKEAIESLFNLLDRHQGSLCGIYSPKECISTEGVPDHKIMNVEHSWPQSAGAKGTAKSDLHHLFIATNATNSMRSDLPFCDVKETLWKNESSKRGYSIKKDHCFEPPENVKGNIARALFYFAIRYKMEIDNNQETFLKMWHEIDPVDLNEEDREMKISTLQNNHNIFVHHPELVRMIKDF